MREIKFRVWEEGTKTMTYLGELYCWEHGYHDGFFTTIGCRPISSIHLDIFTTDSKIWQEESKERFKMMQYTGLKDKNGKEIYEGDIVEFWHDSDKYTSAVSFSEGAFGVKVDDDYWPALFEIYDMEVIGNIHENPDII